MYSQMAVFNGKLPCHVTLGFWLLTLSAYLFSVLHLRFTLQFLDIDLDIYFPGKFCLLLLELKSTIPENKRIFLGKFNIYSKNKLILLRNYFVGSPTQLVEEPTKLCLLLAASLFKYV